MPGSAPAPGEDDLAEALAQEAAKAQRRGRADPFADMDLKFKEVGASHDSLLASSAPAHAGPCVMDGPHCGNLKCSLHPVRKGARE